MRKIMKKLVAVTMACTMMLGAAAVAAPEKVEAACATHNMVSDHIKTEVLSVKTVTRKGKNNASVTCTETTYLNVYYYHCTKCSYGSGGYTSQTVVHSNSMCPAI